MSYLLTSLKLSVAEIYTRYGKKEILDYYHHYIFIDLQGFSPPQATPLQSVVRRLGL